MTVVPQIAEKTVSVNLNEVCAAVSASIEQLINNKGENVNIIPYFSILQNNKNILIYCRYIYSAPKRC